MTERIPDFFIEILVAINAFVMRIARFFAGCFNVLNELLLMAEFSGRYVECCAAVCAFINQITAFLTWRNYNADEYFVVAECCIFFFKDFGGAALAVIKAAAGLLTGRHNIFDKLLIVAERVFFLIKNLGRAALAFVKAAAGFLTSRLNIFEKFFIVAEGGSVLRIKSLSAIDAVEEVPALLSAGFFSLASIFACGCVASVRKDINIGVTASADILFFG